MKPLVTVIGRSIGTKCPFGNEEIIKFDLYNGDCIWIQGPSGRGKTTIAMYIAGLVSKDTLRKLDIELTVTWDESIPLSERCGVLFQQTTLIDELTVAGNIAIALEHCNSKSFTTKQERDKQIKQLLDIVGLQYDKDANKRIIELSGGMGRRASLAVQLAQKKHIIVLDEPFTGLDYTVGLSIAKELYNLRNSSTHQTAFILISHELDLAQTVLGNNNDNENNKNKILQLIPPKTLKKEEIHHNQYMMKNLFGIHFHDRFIERLYDYFFWSLPLIILTFIACGMAIGMLSCDTLRRIDVTNHVLDIVDKEIRPMLKMLTGEEDANAFHVLGVKMKVRQMLNTTIPPAKATLYAMGISKLFILEIGPLLTSLLLCGRIGGSYAGKVATMDATLQNKLLYILGINPILWSFVPALCAALITGPILTIIGTYIALYCSSIIAPTYNIGTYDTFWNELYKTTFPTIRLRGYINNNDNATKQIIIKWYNPEYYYTIHSTKYIDSIIEIITYPPIYHIIKSITYMIIIMIVAELSVLITRKRHNNNITSRNVPSIITSSVVIAGLLIILTDWAFSQLWLQRK